MHMIFSAINTVMHMIFWAKPKPHNQNTLSKPKPHKQKDLLIRKERGEPPRKDVVMLEEGGNCALRQEIHLSEKKLLPKEHLELPRRNCHARKRRKEYIMFLFIFWEEKKKSCVSFMFGFFYFKNLKVKTIKYIKNSKSD